MSAAEKILLEGKDWFREPEAAEYCGLSVDKFRDWYKEVGITPRRVGGRKLYSRADLFAAIDSSPEWQPSTHAAKPSTSLGPRMANTSADPSARLRGQRLREYAPRKRQN